MDKNTNIGNVIQKARQSHGLSQKDLATKLNVTANYISLLENGRKAPSLDFLSLFARKFNLPLLMILDTKLVPTPKTKEEKKIYKELSNIISLYNDYLHASLKAKA